MKNLEIFLIYLKLKANIAINKYKNYIILKEIFFLIIQVCFFIKYCFKKYLKIKIINQSQNKSDLDEFCMRY